MRIGPFSRRIGVSTSVLRAWENRYGLFTPLRTPGGFRLYSSADEQRARRMVAHLQAGLAARESAELVLAAAPAAPGSVEALASAWREFDAVAAHRALDALLGAPDAPAAVSQVILPALGDAAGEWMRDDLGPARIHFASRLLETRLLALGERWHDGPGPLALVGCGPGEQHTLGTIAFALGLHARGWRIAYLGADTPVAGFAAAAGALAPERVVVAFTMPWALSRGARELRGLPGLVLAGPAAGERAAASIGAAWLPADPATAADSL